MADQPRIYAFISNKFGPDDVCVRALAEDGTLLASHISSDVMWAKIDIGVGSDRKHDTYREHYPNGYELEWVDDVEGHAALREAIEANHG